MKKTKIPSRLSIPDLPIEYIETYIHICDAFELTRAQLFMVVTSGNGLVDGGVDKVFPDVEARSEWTELLINKIFSFANQTN